VEKYAIKKEIKKKRFQDFVDNPLRTNEIVIPSRDELYE